MMQHPTERTFSNPKGERPLTPTLEESLISMTVALGGATFIRLQPAVPNPVLYFKHIPSGTILSMWYDDNFSAQAVRDRIARFEPSWRALESVKEILGAE